MALAEYLQQDALGLAELVRRREVTAAELLDVALARNAEVNPRINAVVVPMDHIARERTRQPLGGPFAGVPFLIKDIQQDYAGVPTSSGSRAFRDWRPATHAHFVQRLLDAGTVIFGKTNTPELALKGTTEPELFGPTRNPWNLDHTSGGSSGGAAAAVAAGIVPMAGASDGGGSIRIPAACCGLFGLRPSRGRVSAGPAVGEIWEGASSEHVITRTVRDSAAMLDVLHGGACGDPFRIAPPERSYLEEARREPGRLRIGFSTRSPIDLGVDPECVQAVQDAARLLESLGHTVVEAEPKIDGAALAESFLTMYLGQVAATVAEARERTGARETVFEMDTRALALLGRSLPAGDYVRAHRRWNDFARALGRFHEQYDLYLTPTLARPPARIGEQDTPRWQHAALKPLLALDLGGLLLRSGMVQKMARESLARVPFTQLSNLTGTPSMSVPLHWTAAGLPVGVQFVARFGDEATLLRLAAQLEQARPWRDRRPAL
ncbi:MAG: amidase [Nevskiaceae bacterium]|nr:MAG: amidase [Nevskiaceae bacterium]